MISATVRDARRSIPLGFLEDAIASRVHGPVNSIIDKAAGMLHDGLSPEYSGASVPRKASAGIQEALFAVLCESGDATAHSLRGFRAAMIVKRGHQWCLLTRDGSRTLGCHDTRDGALAQERAILESQRVRAAKNPVAIVFDRTNQKAVDWAKTEAAELVSGITEDTRQALRNVIERAFVEHIPPRQAAELIRPLIGLTDQYAEAVVNLREALVDNPGKIVYAGSDRIAVPVDGFSADEIANITGDYAGSLLDSRAEMIARTETMDASNEGQQQLWEQAVEDGLLPSDIERVWIATDDERECPICEELDGQQVGLDEDFDSEELGAIDGPTAHPNCRCTTGLARAETQDVTDASARAAEWSESDEDAGQVPLGKDLDSSERKENA